MNEDVKKAIKEVEELFGTKAKNDVVYFNEVTYTPIPRPVVEAVEAIMAEHPTVGCQIGTYSVKFFDVNAKPQQPVSHKSSKEDSTF